MYGFILRHIVKCEMHDLRYSGRYVFYISNTLRIPLRKPCLRGLQFPAPLGWQGRYL